MMEKKTIDEARYQMLEDLHQDVFNYIRGMKPEQLAEAKARNGWHHWMDVVLTKIARHDAEKSLAGLSALVGDAKPGPVMP